jgi:hypothetical protein
MHLDLLSTSLESTSLTSWKATGSRKVFETASRHHFPFSFERISSPTMCFPHTQPNKKSGFVFIRRRENLSHGQKSYTIH